MSEAAELHLFLRGELRTDGWMSDWRRELERRRAEEEAKPIVTAPQIKQRQIKALKPKKQYQGDRSKYRAAFQALRQARRDAGLCITCGGESRRGLRECSFCASKRCVW